MSGRGEAVGGDALEEEAEDVESRAVILDLDGGEECLVELGGEEDVLEVAEQAEGDAGQATRGDAARRGVLGGSLRAVGPDVGRRLEDPGGTVQGLAAMGGEQFRVVRAGIARGLVARARSLRLAPRAHRHVAKESEGPGEQRHRGLVPRVRRGTSRRRLPERRQNQRPGRKRARDPDPRHPRRRRHRRARRTFPPAHRV